MNLFKKVVRRIKRIGKPKVPKKSWEYVAKLVLRELYIKHKGCYSGSPAYCFSDEIEKSLKEKGKDISWLIGIQEKPTGTTLGV